MKNKPRASDLKAIPGHRNYYRSASGIIYYKDSQLGKFSTGETTISRARKVVEKRKLEKAGISSDEASDIVRRVTNPLIIRSWFRLMRQKKTENEESTMLKYWVNWNHGIKKFWGTLRVLDITDENIQKYKEWYLIHHPKRYAEKTVTHLGMLFRYMVRQGTLRRLPDLSPLSNLDEIVAKNTKRLKVGRPYTQEEMILMLDAAKKVSEEEYLCARTYCGIVLGGRCGMRKESEILGLPWDKIDFGRKILNVWSTKNKQWREVPMTEEVELALKWQQRFTGNTKYVFSGILNPNKPISGQVFDWYWYRVQEMADIKDRDIPRARRFHDLRGTFASQTANDGWPVKVACDILDMSILEYERTYAKSSPEKRAEFMEKSFGLTKNKEEKR